MWLVDDLDEAVLPGHTSAVKVAVSIPDGLFQAADRAARRLRVPRSQLYVRALESFLRKEGDPGVTARLNRVYGAGDAVPDVPLLEHNLEMLRRVEWEER